MNLILRLPVAADEISFRRAVRAFQETDEDNVGSRRVIEKCGGQFEGLTAEPDLKIQVRRYWIEIR